jgi:vitamin-K-epoxide reductase (warfarin-sensitive)
VCLPRPWPYNGWDMRFLIALLAIAGLIDSVLALRIHMQDPNAAPPCAVTATWDCGTVNHSRFAVFPPNSFDEAPNSKKLHIPVATFGIIGYGLIAVVALADKLWLTLQLAEIGFAFAAFLSYMEAYVLQKWCIYCVWSQVFITAILLTTIAALVLKHRKTRLQRSAVAAP